MIWGARLSISFEIVIERLASGLPERQRVPVVEKAVDQRGAGGRQGGDILELASRDRRAVGADQGKFKGGVDAVGVDQRALVAD